MTLQVREETFDSLEPGWRALAPRAATGSVFTHPSWLRAWWSVLRTSEELRLLSFREGGELLGIAPLMGSGGAVRFIATSDVCDYHDVVAAPGALEACLRALLEHAEGCGWQTLELDGLVQGTPTLAMLPDLARQREWRAEQGPDGSSPTKALPATWDDYLQGLDGKDRHELRRKLRRLSAAGQVRVETATAPADLPERLPLFLDLLKQSREEKAQFMTLERERFFYRLAEAMAAEGLLRLYFLELDGAKVAASLCFDYGGAVLLYNSGYNTRYAPLSAGLLLKALVLKEAIERGRRVFHFLRGAEAYKYDLGAEDTQLFRLTLRR